MPLLLRIFMVVTILGGLGTFYAGMQLKQMKADLTKERDDFHASLDTKTTEWTAEKKAKEETMAKLKSTDQKLTEANSEIASNKTQIEQQLAKIKEVQGQLEQTTTDLAARQADLKKITDSLPAGMSVDEVAVKFKEYKDQATTLAEEKKLLNEQLAKLDAEVKFLQAAAVLRKAGKMPDGLTGHILAMNEDWNFVVLDIGSNNGVVEKCDMIVYRNGTLIGKVKISSVEPSISIADILPEWKQGGIQEGDMVVF